MMVFYVQITNIARRRHTLGTHTFRLPKLNKEAKRIRHGYTRLTPTLAQCLPHTHIHNW